MKALHSFVLAVVLSIAALAPVHAQSLVDTDDPRQLALDVYSGINRAAPEATIAVRLQAVVRLFRYRCTRLTDYQVFAQRTNIIDLKVKCSGDTLYGVTVASNGYVTVYGGNGILSGLNRSDGLIYSFDNEGELSGDSSLTVNQAFGETVDRLDLEDEVNVASIVGIVTITFAFILVFTIVWWRAWKFKQTRKPRERMKPMHKHRVGASSSLKDEYLEESKEVVKNVFKHPDGFYIGRGKSGKRRFFKSAMWAKTYAARGWRLFEISAPERSA
ncbi:hypothetical protein [Kordiimonas aquimaris]|uniref:hypothetical protein n=1 Tax=Kordiimonas aquimaris TaxID=707591 RepID=UPI0021CDF2EE|nr:hypothetical protein [Kordiimonas aquimaris]